MIQAVSILGRNYVKRNLPVFQLVLVLVTAGSCRFESQDSVVIDNKVDIYYINSLHEDLLDTAILGSFREDSIRLYNLENGVQREVNNRDPYPHNFYIYRNEQFQEYVLRVFLEVDTTYIRLSSHITDTIVCTINRSGDNFILSKVWYNGALKWDDYATSRDITVVVK
jgi:hypothetical protein